MQTQPINFHPPTAEIATQLLPDTAQLFIERAKRFETLAEGHSLGDWLHFLGHLTQAQHHALQNLPELPLPDAAALQLAHQHHMPPLLAASLARPPIWRSIVREIAQKIAPQAPEAAQKTINTLLAASDDELEKLADILITGEPEADQLALLPFIAAGLQVIFTAMASQLGVTHLQPLETHGVCPCCGSPPVISFVRLGAEINNLRYLHCSLCNTEWNVPRAICTVCNTDEKVSLHELEGVEEKALKAVRAETCDNCKSYLKITYQEKDHMADPVADDLATLALDMLVDEAGYERSGFNMLIIGANA